MKVWIGFMWLRVGTIGGYELRGSLKGGEYLDHLTDYLASQEELCSQELVWSGLVVILLHPEQNISDLQEMEVTEK